MPCKISPVHFVMPADEWVVIGAGTKVMNEYSGAAMEDQAEDIGAHIAGRLAGSWMVDAE
jgi:hypothetical protein